MNPKNSEQERYSRHLLLKEIGEAGHLKIRSASVLVVGAGGLGCPALQYLAAAGIGTIGIVDFDVVEISNLNRQILFTQSDAGKSKAVCASEKLKSMNPDINVLAVNDRLTAENIRKYMESFDIIIDGSDNFSTRYLVDDACRIAGKPNVFGSLSKFSAQISVFNLLSRDGIRSPGYRDLFPESPSSGIVANCADTGILGSVAGMAGSVMATEAIKLIVDTGNTLAGKLMVIDMMVPEISVLKLPGVSVSHNPGPLTWEELEKFDYVEFCEPSDNKDSIDYSELENLIRTGHPVQIIDVREPWEIENTITENTFYIPWHSIESRLNELNPDQLSVVICNSGYRSALVVNILRKHGFQRASSLNKGLTGVLTEKVI